MAHAALAPAQVAQVPVKVIHVNPVVDVANIQGLTFTLTSANKPTHLLAIQTETYNADGSASFTGTWTGEGPNSNGTGHQVLNGTIKFDANGNTILSFAWTNGQGTQNTFCGSLTPVKNQYPGTAASVYAPRYFLSGVVSTPPGTGGGPGAISGYGAVPFPGVSETY